MAKILILNGPNLNLLGLRNPEQYGVLSLTEIEQSCRNRFPNHELDFLQSNHEGVLIDAIQQTDANAIVINGGGFTHSSVALRDTIEITDIPVVEVHLSNIAGREYFRHTSLLSPVCAGVIFGFGPKSYILGVTACLNLLGQDL